MSVVILRGDAAHLPMADGSVDLIVTSPPYFGQRDYRDGGESLPGQIGGEATPREYIAALLDCTREWMRVLKPSGSIFVDLGDKYSQAGDYVAEKSLMQLPQRYSIACTDQLGLILRQRNIWYKTSGMPESVEDRCATRHEDVVHFTVQPRYFSAIDEIREAHAPASLPRSKRAYKAGDRFSVSTPNTLNPEQFVHPLGKLPGSVWPIATAPLNVPERIEHARCCGGRKRPGCEDGIRHNAAFPPALAAKAILGFSPSGICVECGEGRRPVPLSVGLDMSRPQARRAQQLAERAGLTEDHLAALLSVGVSDTGRGAATQTGTGKNRPEVYELAAAARTALGGYAREYLLRRPTGFSYICACSQPDADAHAAKAPDCPRCAADWINDLDAGQFPVRIDQTEAFEQEDALRAAAAIPHNHPPAAPRSRPLPPTRPAVVLDPCGGTGTTALVASVYGRVGITFDLSADYCRLAAWRTADPGERARALGVPKPPPVPEGQLSLLDGLESA